MPCIDTLNIPTERRGKKSCSKWEKEKEEEEENVVVVVVVVVSKDDRFVDPPDVAHRFCRVPSRFCRARDRGVLFAVGD